MSKVYQEDDDENLFITKKLVHIKKWLKLGIKIFI